VYNLKETKRQAWARLQGANPWYSQPMLKGGFALPPLLPSLVPALWLQGAKLTPSFGNVNILLVLFSGEARHPQGAGRPLFRAAACVGQASRGATLYPRQKWDLIMNSLSSRVHRGCVTGSICKCYVVSVVLIKSETTQFA